MSTERRIAPGAGLSANDPAAALEPLTTLTSASGEKALINILIVDDEPANLLVLETVLDDPSYRLIRARSADQALLELMRQEFALLILDVRMPDMSGFELAQMIKDRKKTARVPIIFLTAYYDKDQHVLEGYGTGAVDYLNKPVNPAVLRSKVAVFADLHRKTHEISLTNQALLDEVAERRRAEEQLKLLNETLEGRVLERTEALRRADSKLQLMMNSITDGLHTLDRDWCFTYSNEQGARLLGMPVEQMIGRPLAELFPQMAIGALGDGYRRAVDQQQTVSFEAFHGEPLNKWFRCHCYPSEDGLSVYFHDITDRRSIEGWQAQLLAAEQAARSESERVARAKDEFLASLSHELRTPLAAIVGWATVLKRPEVDHETLQRGIEAIARNAEAQVHLVADLLDMSRIVSGKLRMNMSTQELNGLAAAAADTARPAALAKGIELVLDVGSGGAIEVLGDSTRLEQIVSNLLTNALKFTPAGGQVKLSARIVGGTAELAVSDTGQGIAERFLPHLFDRFSQADGSAARAHGGLGIGLSIVKNLVELHGGSVMAESQGEGQGSRFTVRLPLLQDPPIAAGPTFGPTSADSHPSTTTITTTTTTWLPEADHPLLGVSVLLVDDHLDVLEAERRILQGCGADVTTASSADEALQLLVSSRFDVMLSDLGMPGMDGYALIETIRFDRGLAAQTMPAAAITAFVRPEDWQRALSAGYQSCVQKPVSPTGLTRAVLDLMNERQPAAEAPAPEQPDSNDPFETAPGTSVGGTRVLRALFVEDNAELRELIASMLEEESVEVVACETGEEAELKFSHGGFDFVVTDVSLPRMSGIELSRRLLARAPDLWVVFSTGYPMTERLEALGPNVRALMKPFGVDEVGSMVQQIRGNLDGARLRQS